MKFNITKYKCIQYGNVNHHFNYKMKDNNNTTFELSFEREKCDLGILFQQNLKFDTHITTKSNNVNRLLGMIKHTFTLMYKDLFRCIYNIMK